ncbi:hypothetical protein E3Q00_02708 [Wallemia mellicola]|nr:hypothetical protein E3Q00_02708 [Wallemia mellicola]
MANVTMAMEQMLPEFKDYEKKNLFTKLEIKSIAAKRKNFETSLGRKTPSQSDYLKYIEYEITLENLKRKRMSRLKIALTPSPALYGIQKRILSLFDKATRKFRGDISLWVKYIEYLKKIGANKLLTRTFSTVINLHPSNPQLYILAASWELHNNVSAHSARTLLQRGLRLNTTDLDLWLAYARMELVFAERVRRRLEFDQQFQENEEKDSDDGVERQLDPEEGLNSNKNLNIRAPDSDKKVMDGAIIEAIIDNARSSLKVQSQLPFFSSLISMLREFPLPITVKHSLLNHTYHTLRLTLPEDPEARLMIAIRPDSNAPEEAGVLDKVEGLKVACNAVTTVMAELQLPQMSEMGLQWLVHRHDNEEEENLKQYINHFIITSFKTSKSRKLLTAGAYLNYIEYLRRSSEAEEKVFKLVNDGLAKHSNSSQLHLLKLELQPSKEAYKEALRLCPTTWELYEGYLFFSLNDDPEGVLKVFETLIADSLYSAALVEANANAVSEGKLTIHDKLLSRFIEINSSHNIVQLSPRQLFPSSFVISPSPGFYEYILSSDIELNENLVDDLYRAWREHPFSDTVVITLKTIKWLLSIKKNSTAFNLFNSALTGLTDVRDKVQLESGWQALLGGDSSNNQSGEDVDTAMEE